MNRFFIIIFLGVNITFFPLHFAGLQGYPRKYIDYMSLFSFYNGISTIGSIISIFGLFLFILIILERLIEYKKVMNNNDENTVIVEESFDTVFEHSNTNIIIMLV
jgi:heme/copper-type cytochrome/quinol oxidase subunit 1